MSQYVHYVPGRLRVRSRSFRCRPRQMHAVAERIKSLPGVKTIDIKQKAGSITIRYDPAISNHLTLLSTFEQAGCLGFTEKSGNEDRSVGELAQKALFGTLIQLTVERSVRSFIGALL